MPTDQLEHRAREHVRRLCAEISERAVGSRGNQAATGLFADVMTQLGFETASPRFAVTDWSTAGVRLDCDGASFAATASPYSLGCRLTAPLVMASTVEELEQSEATERILLLRGEITREQLMPKNFPYYDPEQHRRIIRALEAARPAAVIAATHSDTVAAGALDPFPLIEDGDVDIPSVFMTAAEGERLAAAVGRSVSLESRATRIPSWGCNVVATRGAERARRVVMCAHIDAKLGTPGALDDAAGVATLLLLGELLADYDGALGIEIVAINGEDHYANPGERSYFAANEGRLDDVVLAINLDGVGYREGKDAYSTYGCGGELEAAITGTLGASGVLIPGPPWFQGDHAVFVMHGVPALAVTSEHIAELMATVIHTPHDTPDLVDAGKLVRLARALRELVERLGAIADAPTPAPPRR